MYCALVVAFAYRSSQQVITCFIGGSLIFYSGPTQENTTAADHLSMNKTLEQQIAASQAKMARLMEKKRSEDTGRKVIAGALLINEAVKDKQIAEWFVKKARERVTREVDIKHLEPLLERIELIHSEAVR